MTSLGSKYPVPILRSLHLKKTELNKKIAFSLGPLRSRPQNRIFCARSLLEKHSYCYILSMWCFLCLLARSNFQYCRPQSCEDRKQNSSCIITRATPVSQLPWFLNPRILIEDLAVYSLCCILKMAPCPLRMLLLNWEFMCPFRRLLQLWGLLLLDTPHGSSGHDKLKSLEQVISFAVQSSSPAQMLWLWWCWLCGQEMQPHTWNRHLYL